MYGETGTIGGKKVVTAPWYVSVRVASDASYVEIRYHELHGYNGPQTMREKGAGWIYATPTFAEHQGDWEGNGIRLAPDLTTVIAVVCEAHGDDTSWPPDAVFWVDGTHASFRSAVNSHATYNPKQVRGNVIYLVDAYVADVVDAFDEGGLQWKAWTLPDSYRPFRQIGRTASGIVGTEQWGDFRGRLGSYQADDVGSPTNCDGSHLSGLAAVAAYGNTGVTLVLKNLTSKLPDESWEGAPPTGPGPSPANALEASPTPPLDGQPKFAIFSRVNDGKSLVLSADPKNPQGGGLVLEPYAKGDPAQQWYVIKMGKAPFTIDSNTISTGAWGPYEIVNVKTGRDVHSQGGQGKQLITSLRPAPTPFTLWTIGGDQTTNCAIRPVAADSQNFNVLGNGPYKAGNTVGTWDWSKGAPNETWRLVAQ